VNIFSFKLPFQGYGEKVTQLRTPLITRNTPFNSNIQSSTVSTCLAARNNLFKNFHLYLTFASYLESIDFIDK